jgi:hypothetical protein
MSKHTLVIISCLLISFTSTINAQDSDWETAKNKNGIIVYTRMTDASPIKQCKAVTKIKANFGKIVAMLNDVDNYPNWMANCHYSKIVKEITPFERVDYMQASVPWPFDDRDIVTVYKYEVDYKKGYYYATTVTTPTLMKKVKGFVRLNNGKGSWKLERVNEEVTITYEYSGDPEIAVPNWLINMFIVDSPFETLSNLKKKLE